MEKLKLHTPDQISENVAKLAELVPSCVTETRDEQGRLTSGIDFDQLRQELSSQIVEGQQERYHLDWPGKRSALVTANAPISKTLRPVRAQSVKFDAAKNIFIQGDNLDALKLLKETYLGRVKMIYIDPPYNTGTDRIYRDAFTQSPGEYRERSSEFDESGAQLVLNPESNGRFHSDWLTMLYPRLKLARGLLREDGVIFVSIDNREVASLRLLCDEVFGADNFVGTIVWKNVTDNNPTTVATEHEYIHVYARQKESLERVWKSSLSAAKDALIAIGSRLTQLHKNPDALRAAYAQWFRENKAFLGQLDRYKYIDEGGVYTGSQSVHNPGKDGYRYEVLHPTTGKPCREPLMGYRFPKSTMAELLNNGEILFGDDEKKIIELKVYAKDFADKLASVIDLDGRSGPYDLKELFPEAKRLFTNPKPVELIERLLSFAAGPNDIVVDFFAGSGTTAQATMSLNRQDRGSRRFILIQTEERTDEASEAAKLGYATIAEVCKERVRRAIKLLSKQGTMGEEGQPVLFEGPGLKSVDIDHGFRVLKIDSSNMKDVFYTPDESKQGDLLKQIDNIREDRTPEDLLFQVLVDWGVDLALPIAQETIDGKTVFFVDGNALAACFDQDVTDDLVKEIAKRKPLRAVFRDSSYSSDSVKINVEQIFKLLAPSTEIRSL